MIEFQIIQTKSDVVFVVLKIAKLGHIIRILDYPDMNLTLMLKVFLNYIYLGYISSICCFRMFNDL